MKNKVIFTIDIDAFFSSAEEAANPELKKYPLAIGKDIGIKANRGIVITANYKARDLGIYAGMPIYKVKRMQEEGIKINLIEPRHNYYAKISEKIFSIIKTYSKKIQLASIDECYLDVTKLLIDNNLKDVELAKQIQEDILIKTNIGISIGISDNILLSKMASSVKKPFGIYTIYSHEIKDKLWKLDISKLYGSGVKTTAFLRENNINTIGELAILKPNQDKTLKLEDKLGKKILDLINVANGNSSDEVETKYYDVKTISHGQTYSLPIEKNNIDFEIRKQLEVVIKKMEYRNLVCKSTFLVIKTRDNNIGKYKPSFSKMFTFENHTNDISKIFFQLVKLYEKTKIENIVHITVGVGQLKSNYFLIKQIKMSDLEKNQTKENSKNNEIKDIIFKVNSKFNSNIVTDLNELNKTKKYNNKKLTQNDSIKFKTWDD